MVSFHSKRLNYHANGFHFMDITTEYGWVLWVLWDKVGEWT